MPPQTVVPADFAENASHLVQAIDLKTGLARLVRMASADYRDASFLDDRMFTGRFETTVVRWHEVVGATNSTMASDARWIFHIGHVGSTLIARLLGELTLAVREPRALRDLAYAPRSVFDKDGEAMTRIYSRRLDRRNPTVVKATSFVSEIAPSLCPAGERALFLYASPRAYMCTILAGENSRKGLASLWPERKQRLSGRAMLLGAEASEAHLAAAAWACEMTSLEAAAAAMPDRLISWMDFDSLLADMPTALLQIVGFFGLEADLPTIHSIAMGPIMRRYSKAPEYDYSPDLRGDLLQQAEREYAPSIEAAIDMLFKAAEDSPLLGRALSRSSAITEL